MKIDEENKKNNEIFLKLSSNLQIKLEYYYILAILFFSRNYF